jgi:hypothetical protein
MAGTPAAGTIDVTKGSGEFGRGFYTQKSPSNALQWARGRFRDGCLLQLDIDDEAFQVLDQLVLDVSAAWKLTQSIRRKKAEKSHLCGHDVVIGPIQGQPNRPQQKFESNAAQNLLNGTQTQRTVK